MQEEVCAEVAYKNFRAHNASKFGFQTIALKAQMLTAKILQASRAFIKNNYD